MKQDLEAIFEMESTLKVVTIESDAHEEKKKDMDSSVQDSSKAWDTPPLEARIPA